MLSSRALRTTSSAAARSSTPMPSDLKSVISRSSSGPYAPPTATRRALPDCSWPIPAIKMSPASFSVDSRRSTKSDAPRPLPRRVRAPSAPMLPRRSCAPPGLIHLTLNTGSRAAVHRANDVGAVERLLDRCRYERMRLQGEAPPHERDCGSRSESPGRRRSSASRPRVNAPALPRSEHGDDPGALPCEQLGRDGGHGSRPDLGDRGGIEDRAELLR